MKKPSGSTYIIILIVIVLLLIGGLVYYALNKSVASPSASPTPFATPTVNPTATSNIYTNKYFSFVIPEGWTSSIEDSNKDYPHYTFTSQSGDYLSIDIILGGDSGPDAIWEYTLNGTNPKQMVVTKERADCVPDGIMCAVGDGKLQIGLVSNTNESTMTVDDRYFFIHVGNKKSESTNRDSLREIVKGLKLITKG